MTNLHSLAVVGNGSPTTVSPPSKRIIYQTHFHFFYKGNKNREEIKKFIQRVRQYPVQILDIDIRRSGKQ